MDEEELSGTYADGTNRSIEDIIEQHNASVNGQIGAAAQAVAEEQATNGRLKTSKKTKDIATGKEKPLSKVDEVKAQQDKEYEESRTSGNYKRKYADRPKREKKDRKWRQNILDNLNEENNNNENTPPAESKKEVNYDERAAKVAKANGLGKYVNEDGTIDFDKVEKSKWGYKALDGLSRGLAAIAKGLTGQDFGTGEASGGVKRRQEIQDVYKESQQKAEDDTRDITTHNEKSDKAHAQNKELLGIKQKYNLEAMAKQFEWSTEQQEEIAEFLDQLQREGMDKDLENYSNMTPAQQREFRERFAGQKPVLDQFLSSLASGAGSAVTGAMGFGVGRMIH